MYQKRAGIELKRLQHIMHLTVPNVVLETTKSMFALRNKIKISDRVGQLDIL